MDFAVNEWKRGFSADAFGEIAALWNANAGDRHAFYPWSGELLSSLLSRGGKGLGRIFEARTDTGELAGFAHITVVDEEGYPRVGTVENILVDTRFRRMGMGTALLQQCLSVLAAVRPRTAFVDALGAWPFGYAYNALADGSERSGVFMRETGLYRLFRHAGFEPVRKSLVMRADLSLVPSRPQPPGSGFFIDRRRENTWLDRVFRGRELWDHDLVRSDGRLLSRAIFGFMEGESRHEGRAVFSVFGVNTPLDQQGKGYAGVNLSAMLGHVRELGGEIAELHVYADNRPALALYDGLGFKPVAETMMMHMRW